MANNIYDSLKEHHDELRELMKDMVSSRVAVEDREKSFEEFAARLAAHSGAEERFLYAPTFMYDQALSKARHSAREHDEAEEIVKKMKELDPKGKAFADNAKKLVKEVRHHMEEEENQFFQISKKVLDSKDEKMLNKQYLQDFERLIPLAQKDKI